jgi:hypothetical protein
MKTNKGMLLIKLLLCAALLIFVSGVYAAEQPVDNESEAPAPKAQETQMAKPAMAKMAKSMMTVTGTIMANKNKAGKISSYSLKEDSGDSLLLSKHGKGKELRKMVGKKVEATGTLLESKGKKWITVTEFKEIE